MNDTAGNVTHLRLGERDIYLVGTAHISKHSVAEVERVIRELQPDTVCVELDETRYQQLVNDRRYQNIDTRQLLIEGRVFSTLLSLALASFQRRLGDRLGVRPGAELLAGVETARAVGAQVVLADRDVQITLKRAWANLGPLDKLQLLLVIAVAVLGRSELTEEQVEALKQRETIGDMMSEFATHLPRLQVPLIDERDRYLVDSIRRCSGDRVVAIVGAGHVAGMTRYIATPIERELLVQLPARSVSNRLSAFTLPLLAVAMFSWGYAQHGLPGLTCALMYWSLACASGCATGLLAARASVSTWLLGTLLAPLSALYPGFMSGRVAGLAQLRKAPPSEQDRAGIVPSMLSMKTLRRNRFGHILLTAAGAQSGTAIGALLGALLFAVRALSSGS